MADLTDKEIIEACARASMCVPISVPPHVKLDGGIYVMHISKRCFFYNPLTDRAQAMELVEKLGLALYKGANEWRVTDEENVLVLDANLLRAICLCAARVQIEKEKNA